MSQGLYEAALRRFWLQGQLELRFPFPNFNMAWTIELRLKGVLNRLEASSQNPEDRALASSTKTRIFLPDRKTLARSDRKGPVDLALIREGATSEEIFAERLRNLGVKL
jgi:hypothetical protein